MGRFSWRWFLVAAFAALVGLAASGCEKKDDKERAKPSKELTAKTPEEVQEPVVAGRFYPSDPEKLRGMVRSFLTKARLPEMEGRVFGLMVPHAGYVFSGPVAAYSYKTLQGSGASRFVIMGPSHRVSFSGVYVMDKDAYRTPLGKVMIDRESAGRLVEAKPWISSDDKLYDSEHSLEVQLPFLQELAGDDIIINMVVCGNMSDKQTGELAEALHKTFAQDTIYIASTDMSHGNYPPYKGTEETRPKDMRTLELIKSMDVEAIEKGVRDRSTPLCGGMPVLVLMKLFALEGGREVKVLHYADSGDATGDHSKVVGYGAAAFLLPGKGKRETRAGGSGFHLTKEDKIELLKMARARVEAAIKKEEVPFFETSSENLKRVAAAFVTLKRAGRLRGCIGSIVAQEPLYKCVQRRAVDAALHDSRFVFNPIKPSELDEIEIEVSVLTPLQRTGPEEVEVGRDGVLLTLGQHRGVFLPQVPVENRWDREQYLSHLCGKAGVRDPGCWRRPDAELSKFQAIVFSEEEIGL